MSDLLDSLLVGLLLVCGMGEAPLLLPAAGTTVMMPGSPSLLPAAPMLLLVAARCACWCVLWVLWVVLQ